MIKIINGDLFSTDAKIIAHQVNCRGKMGAGVAKQVKTKFPHVYAEYCDFLKSHTNPLGEVLLVPTEFNENAINSPGTIAYNGQYIANLFAQNQYGFDKKQYTDLESLEKCFYTIKRMTQYRNNLFGSKIAMPYQIGCGYGGANWDKDVFPMIDKIFTGSYVELYKLK